MRCVRIKLYTVVDAGCCQRLQQVRAVFEVNGHCTTNVYQRYTLYICLLNEIMMNYWNAQTNQRPHLAILIILHSQKQHKTIHL